MIKIKTHSPDRFEALALKLQMTATKDDPMLSLHALERMWPEWINEDGMHLTNYDIAVRARFAPKTSIIYTYNRGKIMPKPNPEALHVRACALEAEDIAVRSGAAPNPHFAATEPSERILEFIFRIFILLFFCNFCSFVPGFQQATY